MLGNSLQRWHFLGGRGLWNNAAFISNSEIKRSLGRSNQTNILARNNRYLPRKNLFKAAIYNSWEWLTKTEMKEGRLYFVNCMPIRTKTGATVYPLRMLIKENFTLTFKLSADLSVPHSEYTAQIHQETTCMDSCYALCKQWDCLWGMAGTGKERGHNLDLKLYCANKWLAYLLQLIQFTLLAYWNY